MNNKKTVPGWIKKPVLIKFVRSDIGIILSYWLFQGILYMDIREKIFKIFLDILLTIVFFFGGLPLVVAFILAHTANMLMNGHFFAMKSHMGKGTIEPGKFINYVDALYNRIQKKEFLIGAAAYGSLSRNIFRSTSDIDVRIFPEEKTINWPKAIFWIFIERLRALIYRFPLDIYAFDLKDIHLKMKADERPIIFVDPKGVLSVKYRDKISFEEFTQNFKISYVKR